jgi:hypothetical protein
MNMWLGKIKSYHFQISIASGKGVKVKRRSVYRKLYKEVEKAIRHIRQELKKHGSIKEAVLLPPSKRERLDKFWDSIADDMDDAELVMAYSRDRIIDEKDTGVEKIVSLSDGSAAFISKGGRETIVGYRPQVGRSGNSFVTVLHVPEGNAGDAPQLEPLFPVNAGVSAHPARSGSHWTLQSSLRKNYSGQLIIVTGCGVFRRCSGCISCITGSFYRSSADVPGILLQCSFMKLLIAGMFFPGASSYPRPSVVWPTGMLGSGR